MDKSQTVLLPDEISEIAKKLYQEKFRKKFEKNFRGEFLAIDVINKKAYHGKYPEDAIREARNVKPDGTYFLYRIGEAVTFNVGQINGCEKPLERFV